ncbi:MAG: ankyrin repeat domain-containing protein, partial [Chloroflexi bacterium]|nr:ankyrin repeat domain-containing protein [Chloroflexota bacterium]
MRLAAPLLMLLVVCLVYGCQVAVPGTDELKQMVDAQETARLKRVFQAHPEVLNMPFGGYSLLQYAALRDKPKVAKLLLELGANPEEIDSRGATVLMTAALNDSATTADVLLTAGANPDRLARVTFAKESATALDVAAIYGHLGTAEVLLEHGARDILAPFTFALLQQDQPMVDLLDPCLDRDHSYRLPGYPPLDQDPSSTPDPNLEKDSSIKNCSGPDNCARPLDHPEVRQAFVKFVLSARKGGLKRLVDQKVLDHKAEFEVSADEVTPVVDPVPLPLAGLGFEALPIPVSSLVEGEPPAFITDQSRLVDLVRFRVTVGGQVHEGTAGELA